MPEDIESLKEAVDVAISFPMQAVKTIKGKFKLWDLLAFADEAKNLIMVVNEKEEIIAELEDLTVPEIDELIQYAKERFDIPNDAAEVFIENGISWLRSTFNMIEQAKKLKKK